MHSALPNTATVSYTHLFVLDWREDVSDIRRDLSIANYQYTDTKKSLWVAGANDTDESAAEKDADPVSYTHLDVYKRQSQ